MTTMKNFFEVRGKLWAVLYGFDKQAKLHTVIADSGPRIEVHVKTDEVAKTTQFLEAKGYVPQYGGVFIKVKGF